MFLCMHSFDWTGTILQLNDKNCDFRIHKYTSNRIWIWLLVICKFVVTFQSNLSDENNVINLQRNSPLPVWALAICKAW